VSGIKTSATKDTNSLSSPSFRRATDLGNGLHGGCGAHIGAASPSDWPNYNRTVMSERFSPLSAINTTNADKLKVVCSFDTGETTAFQSGLVQINGAIFATTEHDTFALDADSCKLNWHAREFPRQLPRRPAWRSRIAASFAAPRAIPSDRNWLRAARRVSLRYAGASSARNQNVTFRANTDPADLARCLATIIYGMAVQAAGGASRDKLQRVVEIVGLLLIHVI
jgi:hypothetical protein